MAELRDRKNLAPPGSQRLFADFATASDLVARIGLDADSNVHTSRRLLTLFESDWIFNKDAREMMVQRLLERYCSDYCPSSNYCVDHPVVVPHFLLNDAVRFWRTMTVDFGAKQWSALRDDWGLRYHKLLTTRKVLFAGTLSTLFRTEVAFREVADDQQSRYDALIAYLTEEFGVPPLERLMRCYGLVAESDSRAALVAILDAYNQFIDILDLPEARTVLSTNELTDDGEIEIRQRADWCAQVIGEQLQRLFFDEPLFAQLTREYGLF